MSIITMRGHLFHSAARLFPRLRLRTISTSTCHLSVTGARSDRQHSGGRSPAALPRVHGNIKLAGHIFSHGRQAVAASYDANKGWVDVEWEDGSNTQYPHLWLRDNCTCGSCYNPYSLSRILPMVDLDITTTPEKVEVDKDAGSVQVTWSDGHVSQFASDWLEGRSFTKEVQEERQKWMHPLKPKMWGSEMAEAMSTFSFEQLIQEDRVLYDWITALDVYGMALVKGAPCSPNQVCRIGDRVAFLRRNNYGDVAMVVAEDEPVNLSNTANKLGFHNDLCFYKYSPGMEMLHCIKQRQTEGGETQLVDGFRTAMVLKERHPDMFNLLVSTPVDYQDIGTGHYRFLMMDRKPTICLDSDGNVNKISFNSALRDSFQNIPLELVHPLYVALKTFNSICYEPESYIQFKLEEGDIVCVNNDRVMHGRTAFKRLQGGERYLESCYMEWDELHSRRRVLISELRLYE